MAAPDDSTGPDASARPITFATWLHDTVPMPDEIGRRLRTLEGKQPALSEMRLALGFGLDLSGAWPAAEPIVPDFGEPPSDEQLAALLDALYNSIRGSRVVQVRMSVDAELAAGRDQAPIAIREGERLVLLLVAANASAVETEFWAEAHGDGCATTLPPQRTSAVLFDAGAMPAGSYLLPLMFGAAGAVASLDLPIECVPAGTITVRIFDATTGERVAARIYCSDDRGPVAPAGVPLRRDRHGNPWFHADGAFEATASGRLRVLAVRGIEYEPEEATLTVPADGTAAVDLRLRRWSHMAADGWRSGDVHVHLHYGGELALTAADAALAQRAEDVHFLHMMVANCNDGARILDREFFEGHAHQLSGDHILQWGEEFRNNLYGHLCLFGIDALVEPICTGVPFTSHPHDWPANSVIAASAHETKGTVSYAHPILYDGTTLDRIFTEARTVEAKALPVDAALGRIDAVDVMSYPGKDLDVAAVWYRLLNCGLRLAATAGTDTFMNMDDAAELLAFPAGSDFSSPPAGARAFVRIEGDFSSQAWCDGVRRGETFVTNAPMLDFSVNGCRIGGDLRLQPGDIVRVQAAAGSYAPMDRVELIVNGEIAASCDATLEGRFAEFSHQFVAEESCWLALRALGPRHDLVLGDRVFAHTSPIYLSVDDRRIARPEDAPYFVDWIDRLIAMTRAEGRFASEAQRDAVLAVFRQGQTYYRAIAKR